MPSTPTPRLRVMQQAKGEGLAVWGEPNLNNALARLEEAIADVQTIAVSGPVTLTSNNYIADQARAAGLKFTGTGGTVTIPSVTKRYEIINSASGAVVIAAATGATAAFQTGEYGAVVFDGVNVIKTASTIFDASQAFSSTSTTANAIGTGTKTYTTQSGRAYSLGMGIKITDNAAPTVNTMTGTVTAYSGTTLSVNITAFTGSGTPAAVTIGFAGSSFTLPPQAGNTNKFLQTDGTAPLWSTLPTAVAQSAVKATAFSTTSTTAVDITGLSVTLAPSLATSRVLVMAKVVCVMSGTGSGFLQLVKDAAVIDGFPHATFNNTSGTTTVSIVSLVSPASTSAATYKVQAYTSVGTVPFNIPANYVSTIVAVEIL